MPFPFGPKTKAAVPQAEAAPDWDAVRPGDYIECCGNVGRVDTHPDGSKSFIVYPAELTRHIKRPEGQPVEQRDVPYVGRLYVNTFWFEPTACAGNTYAYRAVA